MEELLRIAAHYVSMAIEAVAVLVIAYGAAETVVMGVRALARRTRALHPQERALWLHFARWLVVGLQFQLAADIVQTTVAPTWDQLGRVGAIAAIRTFLGFFLDRDIEEVRRAPSSTEQELAGHAE